MSTKNPPRAKRRHSTQYGKAQVVQLDPQTKAKLVWSACMARFLGVNSNASTVVRAAIELYAAHLEQLACKLDEVPEDSQDGRSLLVAEQRRLESANRGWTVPEPWRQHGLNERRVEERMASPSMPFPTYTDLVKQAQGKERSREMDIPNANLLAERERSFDEADREVAQQNTHATGSAK